MNLAGLHANCSGSYHHVLDAHDRAPCRAKLQEGFKKSLAATGSISKSAVNKAACEQALQTSGLPNAM
jgi:hypothetical protein